MDDIGEEGAGEEGEEGEEGAGAPCCKFRSIGVMERQPCPSARSQKTQR